MNAMPALIREVDDAIARGTTARRADHLRKVTDLFLRDAPALTDEQVDLFDVVIARLAAAIEARARIELAERLADAPNAPRGVIRTLAHDDIDIAPPGARPLEPPVRRGPGGRGDRQGPRAHARHLGAPEPERAGHRRAGEARRPQGRARGGRQSRGALLRRLDDRPGRPGARRRGAPGGARRPRRPARGASAPARRHRPGDRAPAPWPATARAAGGRGGVEIGASSVRGRGPARRARSRRGLRRRLPEIAATRAITEGDVRHLRPANGGGGGRGGRWTRKATRHLRSSRSPPISVSAPPSGCSRPGIRSFSSSSRGRRAGPSARWSRS